MNYLSWTCHVCGRERPDELIGVRKFEFTMPGGSVVGANVRYCLDTPACWEGAPEVSFVKSVRELAAPK